jgi:hypothetical protein
MRPTARSTFLVQIALLFLHCFPRKTERLNADFHRLSGGNDDRDASFSMPQKHSLSSVGTIPDHPIHMS